MEPKPLKYKPPEHVIQLSPDFSMLSHTKPKKRRKRKGDDPFVWLGDVGTTSFRKRPKHKKKEKEGWCHYYSQLSLSLAMSDAIDICYQLLITISI